MGKKFTAIDLFSGCGGLSEGFLETGAFDFLAHVEWEIPMINTLRNNLINRWNYNDEEAMKSVVRFDIQKTEQLIHGSWDDEATDKYSQFNSKTVIEKGLDGIINGRTIDVIVGGPPCQAYSIAGRAQDPNSMKDDYRNYLFEGFVKVVDYYKPKVFVFENVPGILSAKPGDKLVIERIIEAFNEIGYEIRSSEGLKKSVYSSADYEVPQSRRRVIIYGVNKENDYSLEDFYASLDANKSDKIKTVYDAIGKMPKFRPLEKPYKYGNKNVSHELIGETKISLHEPRYHNKRDIDIFEKWVKNSMNCIQSQEKIEFYKQMTGKDTKHNKYRSLEWDKPSPTIVSHLYKDGLMFIHPDVNQKRSITVREAAILQTFPLDFEFVGSNAYCFKMIGNAVPVLFAKNIAKAVITVLKEK